MCRISIEGTQHAQYDSTRSAHAGFRDNICSPQAMWDEGPGEPYSAHGHYINMTNPSYTMVACGFYETSEGCFWAVQNFQ